MFKRISTILAVTYADTHTPPPTAEIREVIVLMPPPDGARSQFADCPASDRANGRIYPSFVSVNSPRTNRATVIANLSTTSFNRPTSIKQGEAHKTSPVFLSSG